MTKLNNLITRL